MSVQAPGVAATLSKVIAKVPRPLPQPTVGGWSGGWTGKGVLLGGLPDRDRGSLSGYIISFGKPCRTPDTQAVSPPFLSTVAPPPFALFQSSSLGPPCLSHHSSVPSLLDP